MPLKENAVEYHGAHAWRGVESVSAKLEPAASLAVRLEPNGSTVRLRGSAEVKSGKKLEVGDVMFKFPEAVAPATTSRFPFIDDVNGTEALEVSTAGTVTFRGGTTIESPDNLYFDGITWSIS